jgi:glutathione S-transferase
MKADFNLQMEKGDPEMRLLLGAEPPAKSIMSDGGIESSIWKKDAKNSNRL